MDLTYQYKVTFAFANQGVIPALIEERDIKIAELVQQGKTDGRLEKISDTIFLRFFIDEAAALEFQTWALDTFAKYNLDPLPTTEINPI